MITIFSQCLAGYLMMRGFVLQGMEETTKGTGKNVFFFKNSDKLSEAIQYFTINRQSIDMFVASQKE